MSDGGRSATKKKKERNKRKSCRPFSPSEHFSGDQSALCARPCAILRTDKIINGQTSSPRYLLVYLDTGCQSGVKLVRFEGRCRPLPQGHSTQKRSSKNTVGCRLRVSRADLYFCFRSSKNASHISGVAHEFEFEGKVFPHNLVVGTGCFLRNRSRAGWKQAKRRRRWVARAEWRWR